MADVPPPESPASGWPSRRAQESPPAGPEAPTGPPPPPPPPGGYQPPPPPPGQQPGGWQPSGPGAGGQPAYGQQQKPTDAQGRPLAEWWKRLVAIIIDIVILWVPLAILGVIVGVSLGETIEYDATTGEFTESGGLFAGTQLVLWIVSIIVPLLYYSLLNGSSRGQTVGKMLLKIQVRDANTGGPIGVGRGFLRHFITILLAIPCLIGTILDALWPLWDQRRQALHDKVANSLVVDAT